jgi:hypothetical protein
MLTKTPRTPNSIPSPWRLSGLVLLVVPLFFAVGCQNKAADQDQDARNEAEKEKETEKQRQRLAQELAARKEVAEKKISALRLRQIALAMDHYNQTFKKLPSAAYMDLGLRARMGLPELLADDIPRFQTQVLKGKPLPLLSWRVAILPFIEQQDLYKEFKMEEPWDSPHNKKLLARMPKTFAPARGSTKEPYSTYYQVFVGKDAPFDGLKSPRIPISFPDGTSNTFLIVEAGEAVPWPKPEDIPYAADKPVPKLGGLFPDGFHAAFVDGTIRFIPKDTEEKTIRALITPAGAEDVQLPGTEVKTD